MVRLSTLQIRAYWIKRYMEWAKLDRATVSKLPEFIDYLKQRGLAPSTINVAYHSLKHLAEITGEEVPHVSLPPVEEKIPSFLSENEIKMLIDGIPNLRDQCIVALLYDAALRRGELVALNCEDVNLKEKTVTIRRREKEVYPHVVPLSERTAELLQRYLRVRKCKSGGALFTNDVGERLSPSAVYYIVRQWGLRLLNKPIHPHQLRHSCAIALRKQGIPIELIGDFLGHKNLNTTRRYARILPAELKEKIPQRV